MFNKRSQFPLLLFFVFFCLSGSNSEQWHRVDRSGTVRMAQSEAQLITAGLYLGPHQVAQDSVTLAQLGVTRVMSVLGPDQDFDRVAVPAENKSWVQVTDRVEAEIEMARELPAAVERLLEWEVHRQHVSIKPAQPRPQCTCMYHMRTIARMLTRSLDGFTCSCASDHIKY